MSTMTTLALVMATTGCATVAGSKAPPQPLAGKVYYATQASIGPCPSNEDKEGAVLAGIAASVISQGVSKIGEALKAAGDADTQTALAERNLELRTANGIGPCVVIARGWFFKRIPPLSGETTQDFPFASNPDSAFPARNDRNHVQEFWRIGLNIAATPDFYFKGLVKPSVGNAAYVIYPIEATLDTPISSNFLRPSNRRSVMVAFALSEAGTNAGMSKAGTVVTLGAMRPGELLEYPDQTCFAAFEYRDKQPVDRGVPDRNDQDPRTLRTTGSCPAEDEFSLLIRNPVESSWFKVESSTKVKPMTLQALVTETRSASRFLQFAAAVLGDTSKPITEELQKRMIPSISQEASLAELTADETKVKAYDTALAKAYTDLTTCINEPAVASKRIGARVALRDFVAAARNAEQSNFQLNPDAISTGGQDATECKTERDKIK